MLNQLNGEKEVSKEELKEITKVQPPEPIEFKGIEDGKKLERLNNELEAQ